MKSSLERSDDDMMTRFPRFIKMKYLNLNTRDFKNTILELIVLRPKPLRINVGVCISDNTVSLMVQSHEFTFLADIFLTILLPAFIYLALAAFRFNPESKKGLG